MLKLTKEQINKKYKGRYVEIYRTYDHEKQCDVYEVRKSYKNSHENTTLGEDVGTEYQYKR